VKALVGYFFGALVVAGLGLVGCGGKREHVGNRSEGSGGSIGTGGSAGPAGMGGDAGQDPNRQQRSSKLDLLLVIDNSRSMADKQAVLGRSAASLVSRLINPPCVDETGTAVEFPPADQPCAPGGKREMAPVRDMHIGVISSSLGGHGADRCSPALAEFDPTENDRGELLVRAGETYQGRGYLLWDPDQTASPPGDNDWSLLASKVGSLVTGAGELGCGFESTLEAWYRFLIDPEPPAEVVVKGGVAVIEGVNHTLLEQRARFLRPDSAVLVVMLTDENDCSIQDGGAAWMAGQSPTDGNLDRLDRATRECAGDPNSPCCRSCLLAESQPPSGCAPLREEAACRSPTLTEPDDGYNLRCFDQKRRFGVDFLYPLSRYVRGLTSPTVPDRSGAMVPNPLFADPTARGPSLISVAAIVGVPWQDLAQNPEDAQSLRYMTSRQLELDGRWKAILGDPVHEKLPADPFMRESIEPRSGENPVTGDAIQPPSAPGADASPINGHEWDPPERNDLQYACIFPLSEPRECGNTSGCDCSEIDGRGNKVLCQGPDGAYGTRQYFAKAYPGLRHLELLRQLGDSAVVASICPRNLGDPSREDYAYRPAVQAIVDRMTNVMKNQGD
jgi:hypothetical protein